MSWPIGMPLRSVSFGQAVVFESGMPLAMRVTIKASRTLVHRPSGSPLVSVSTVFTSDLDGQRVLSLPVCDSPDMGTGNGAAIALGPNQVTHTYTATVEYLDPDTMARVPSVAPRTIGPFAVLSGEDVVDLDDLLSGSTTEGTTVLLSGPTSLDRLSDVDTAGSAAGMSLVFDGTTWRPGTVTGGGATVSDADGTTKGVLRLAGDLGGTADAPTVPGLAGKENSGTAAALVAGHEQAADPHPQYLTAAEGDTRYAAAGAGGGGTGTVKSVNTKLPDGAGNVTLAAADVAAIPAQEVTRIEVLSQAEYDALPVKDPTTLYMVEGGGSLNGAVEGVPMRSGVWYTSEHNHGSSGANTMSSETARAVPITLRRSGTLTGVGFHVATVVASGMAHMAIYRDAGGVPGTRVARTDPVETSGATGWREAAVSVPVTAGETIWVAVRAVSTSTLRSFSQPLPSLGSIGIPNLTGPYAAACLSTNTSGDLPATWPATIEANANAPIMFVKF